MTGDNWAMSHQPVPLVQKSRDGESRLGMHFSLLSFRMAQAVITYLCHTHNPDMFSLSAYNLTGFVLLPHSPKNYEMIPCILPYATVPCFDIYFNGWLSCCLPEPAACLICI